MARDLTVLIMAAGHGTRMRSSLPKVLHPVCGLPMVEWVVNAARGAGASQVVCITRPGEGVAERLDGSVEVAEQREGEGTGAAVLAAREAIERSRTVVVLSGDHPLVDSSLIADLVDAHEEASAAATLLTTDRIDPAGYGRVVRAEDGTVERIVETKYPDRVPPEELEIREINIGAYAFAADDLLTALDAVAEEEHGERYLTEVFPVLKQRGRPLAAHMTADVRSAMGVNTRADLIEIETLARRALIVQHATNGVSFTAPETVAIDATVEIAPDTTIGPGVTLRGTTRIGAGCVIGPQATLIDTSVGDNATVLHSVTVEAEIGANVSVGPFAYLRPGTRLAEDSKAGTFVEIKNSNVGPGAKVPHLSYVGDADIGEGANLGASSITANYDGKRKHRTTIGKGAKTGVHTSLVAPVTVGEHAYTGAGSVVRKDVPEGGLAYSDARQRNIKDYNPLPEKDRSE